MRPPASRSDRAVVHDEARIEQVVERVKAHADVCGLDHGIAEPVWRTLISRCIVYEFEVWDRLHAQVGRRAAAGNASRSCM